MQPSREIERAHVSTWGERNSKLPATLAPPAKVALSWISARSCSDSGTMDNPAARRMGLALRNPIARPSSSSVPDTTAQSEYMSEARCSLWDRAQSWQISVMARGVAVDGPICANTLFRDTCNLILWALPSSGWKSVAAPNEVERNLRPRSAKERGLPMADTEAIETTARNVSRRNFIKGVIAGGAATYSASYLFRGGGSVLAQSSAPGAVERLMTLNVNGQARPVDVMKQETLATTLRYKLGLTGTKVGCDRAECGSCTVLIDGVTHYSCSILTHTVRGRQVVTIEGLAAADGTLHPVQQAVVDGAGFQCAFCAPGFIISMVAMVESNSSPTRKEAAESLSGNLCRCCDYDKILDCAMSAADYTRGG